MNLRRSRPSGQGLLESVLCLPLALALITMLFIVCYRTVIYYYADFRLHEALVCTDDASLRSCQSKLQQKISHVLIAHEKLSVQLSQRENIVQGKVSITEPWSFQIEKKMHFPIKVQRSWL